MPSNTKQTKTVGTGANTASGDRGFDRVLDYINGGVGTADSLWCLLNPRRAGCPGDPNAQPTTVVQNYSAGIPPWVYVVLALLILLVLMLYFRKK